MLFDVGFERRKSSKPVAMTGPYPNGPVHLFRERMKKIREIRAFLNISIPVRESVVVVAYVCKQELSKTALQQ